MREVSDVVIVGGGIAGSSLAYSLASHGLVVTVLEASAEFEDRVRGEAMMPWGVKEARQLGVEQVLLGAGAHVAPMWKQYDEGAPEPALIPTSMIIDGIPGTLNIRHPDACQALVDAAAGVGATVVRNVHDIKLMAGPTVSVSYFSGEAHEVTARLVVGADGRSSTVRRQAGITLQRQDPISYIAGLLVDGLEGIPDDHDVVVSEGDLYSLMFHQGGGRARLYMCPGRSGQRRFAGPDAARRFLAAWNRGSYPLSGQITSAVAAGPCVTYPGDDTWTPTPYADRIILIGDAAGHNDPIIGQGLSNAMRDVRMVTDLILDGARQPAHFTSYGEERSERLRRERLLADMFAVTHAEDADNRMARRRFLGEKVASMDPEVFPLLLGVLAGPETVPDQLVHPRILDRIRSA